MRLLGLHDLALLGLPGVPQQGVQGDVPEANRLTTVFNGKFSPWRLLFKLKERAMGRAEQRKEDAIFLCDNGHFVYESLALREIT